MSASQLARGHTCLGHVIDILIVLSLIVLNGLFALSELAVVSSRRQRLRTMMAAQRFGAQSAFELSSDPGRFLSAVQIGITLIGLINGVFSGETFGEDATAYLQQLGISKAIADPLGYGLVIAVVTYLSVIIGELVPKNLALRNPEAIACIVAPAMAAFAKFAAPAVWLLDQSTKLVFRVFGQSMESEARVTDEEIKSLVAEAESAGVLESGEREMISGVMRLADRAVVGLMTPRTDVEWIDVAASDEDVRARLSQTSHSRLPAGEGSIDKVLGVVQTRELLTPALAGKQLDVRSRIRKVPIIPETMDALDVVAVLRNADVPMAFILDEHGEFEGLVTPADVLEAIAGVFKSDIGDDDEYAVERADGSWLLSGSMPFDEMADQIGFPLPSARTYETVAGFVLANMKRIPTVGEGFEQSGWRFEVLDLDGRRIDKVLGTRTTARRRMSAE